MKISRINYEYKYTHYSISILLLYIMADVINLLIILKYFVKNLKYYFLVFI